MTDQLADGDLDGDAAAPAAVDGPTVAPSDASADTIESPGRSDEIAPDVDGAVAGVATKPKRRRVSRWDRPPEPRDWRFYVGNLGRVLIATGLLLFGFVAYQLWGTGIETARAQNRLEDEFAQLLAEFDTGDDSAVEVAPDPTDGGEPAAGTDDDTDVDAPAEGTTGSDGDGAIGSDGDGASGDDLDITVGEVTTATPIAVDLSDQAVVQDPIPQPFRGDPLFRLEIPAIDRDDIVIAGVSLDDLKAGPGHYPDTPLPGQLGNASVAGHRTTYGAPFFDVDQLRAGDELITTLANGDRFVYEVTFVEVVTANDYWVVTTSDPNIAEFTLTSCHPKYTARDRIVVHSVLNPDKSSTVGFPTFYELEAADDDPIPGDDPVLVADEFDPNDIVVTEGESVLDRDTSSDADADADTAAPGDPATDDADTSADAETDGDIAAGGVTDDGTDVGDDESSAAPAERRTRTVPATPGDPVDAFSQGWFDDTAAWPQIALWALVLIAICVLAYQIAKRLRRTSVGLLVGVVPFFVALYFFYQNVNRLLPPGI